LQEIAQTVQVRTANKKWAWWMLSNERVMIRHTAAFLLTHSYILNAN